MGTIVEPGVALIAQRKDVPAGSISRWQQAQLHDLKAGTMPIQENLPEPGGVTAPPVASATLIQEEKPRPPRLIQWLRLALLLSYLLPPLCLLAGIASGNYPGYIIVIFIQYVLPFMLLISLIYLGVWLTTRRRYRFDSFWTTTIIVLMSALQLIVVAVAAFLLYQLSTYNNPYG